MDDRVKQALDFFKNGKYKEALESFSEIEAFDKTNPHVYNNIGLCYAKLGEDKKAEENYKKALFINANLPQTYINLADLFYKVFIVFYFIL